MRSGWYVKWLANDCIQVLNQLIEKKSALLMDLRVCEKTLSAFWNNNNEARTYEIWVSEIYAKAFEDVYTVSTTTIKFHKSKREGTISWESVKETLFHPDYSQHV